MKLVTNETTTGAEKPTVALADMLASEIPTALIEGLKNVRQQLGIFHAAIVDNHGMIPSYLGGAYTAIEDAEGFLKQIANGKEEFTPVPKKPEVKEADKPTADSTIKVPANLADIPYVQEWAGQFLFPTLRLLTMRKDVEVEIRANRVKKKLHLVFSVSSPNSAAVLLNDMYASNSVIDLVAVAKSIDAL